MFLVTVVIVRDEIGQKDNRSVVVVGDYIEKEYEDGRMSDLEKNGNILKSLKTVIYSI